MGDLDITSLLPLDRFAQIIGLDPRHFRQVTTTYKPVNTCAKVWKEHAWQETDEISRDDIVLALNQAEEQFSEHLGFKVLPDWIPGERHRTPKPGDKNLYHRQSLDIQGFNISLPLRWGHYVEPGVKTLSLISAGVAVTLSDADTDGYAETATISFATTVTDEQELAVFYPGKSGAANWEIRPWRTCAIAAGVATMTFWKHQLVLESLIEALEPDAVNGDLAANFLTTVDVYRRYSLPTDCCTMIWDFEADSCNDECCEPTTQTACLVPRDYETSIVGYQPATYDATTEAWTSAELEVSRAPDQLVVAYRAGYQDKRRAFPLIQMDVEFERAISYYALTLLRREVCSCSNVENMMNHWTTDMAVRTPGGATYNVSQDLLDNPMGTTRAAIHAWRLINRRLIARAVDY